jgi:hypothetical protein
MKTNWKDVLLGLLVAYVVIDMMIAYTMKGNSCNCLEKMVEAIGDQSGIVAVIFGVLVGVVVWCIASRSKECFIPAPSVVEDTVIDEE